RLAGNCFRQPDTIVHRSNIHLHRIDSSSGWRARLLLADCGTWWAKLCRFPSARNHAQAMSEAAPGAHIVALLAHVCALSAIHQTHLGMEGDFVPARLFLRGCYCDKF